MADTFVDPIHRRKRRSAGGCLYSNVTPPCRSIQIGQKCRVCHFVVNSASTVQDATFTVLDLATYGLPFFDEPVGPFRNGSV
ncbi:hypothetical protein KKP3000_003027 [Alicyclobacillus fastidiosus]|uniref:Uncharacterized protein n=1 Tax=Alicyclobacillus fastidiosus TaxID=392011 RepID=A0ABV5AD28_9BACL